MPQLGYPLSLHYAYGGARVHADAGSHLRTPEILEKSQDPQRLGRRAHDSVKLGLSARLCHDSLRFRVGANEVATDRNRPPEDDLRDSRHPAQFASE